MICPISSAGCPPPQTSWVRYPQGNLTQQWPTSAPATQGRSHIKLAGSPLYWGHSIFKPCPSCWWMLIAHCSLLLEREDLWMAKYWDQCQEGLKLQLYWYNLYLDKSVHCTALLVNQAPLGYEVLFTPRGFVSTQLLSVKMHPKIKTNRELACKYSNPT